LNEHDLLAKEISEHQSTSKFGGSKQLDSEVSSIRDFNKIEHLSKFINTLERLNKKLGTSSKKNTEENDQDSWLL
jgi:hypothetical protein